MKSEQKVILHEKASKFAQVTLTSYGKADTDGMSIEIAAYDSIGKDGRCGEINSLTGIYGERRNIVKLIELLQRSLDTEKDKEITEPKSFGARIY